MTKTDRVTEPKDFYHYLESDEYDVKNAQLVNDETYEIQYVENEGFVDDNDKVNVVISSNVLTDFAAQVPTGQRSAGSEQRILHVIQNIVDSDVWRGDNPRVLNP